MLGDTTKNQIQIQSLSSSRKPGRQRVNNKAYYMVLLTCALLCQFYAASGICALKATMAFLVSRWSLNNSSSCLAKLFRVRQAFCSRVPTGFLADFVHVQASVPVWIWGRRFLGRLHVPCRPFWSAHEKWLVLDTIWRFELEWHEHQSVGGRCVFQSAVCKVTYELCDEMCTDDTTCFLAHGSVCGGPG
jgi:hypothetical protein